MVGEPTSLVGSVLQPTAPRETVVGRLNKCARKVSVLRIRSYYSTEDLSGSVLYT